MSHSRAVLSLPTGRPAQPLGGHHRLLPQYQRPDDCQAHGAPLASGQRAHRHSYLGRHSMQRQTTEIPQQAGAGRHGTRQLDARQPRPGSHGQGAAHPSRDGGGTTHPRQREMGSHGTDVTGRSDRLWGPHRNHDRCEWWGPPYSGDLLPLSERLLHGPLQ